VLPLGPVAWSGALLTGAWGIQAPLQVGTFVYSARLRRSSVHLWSLEIAGYGGNGEPTRRRDTHERLVAALVENFGRVLTPQDDSPWPRAST